MPTIPYLKKKIGNSYLVWFRNSNLYLQLEEPAWFVLRMTAKRYKSETIAHKFEIRYTISSSESLKFVQEIRSEIMKMNQPDMVQNATDQLAVNLIKHTFVAFSIHHYRLGEKLISIAYQTRNFENYIHPLISHFETKGENTEMPLLELFAHYDKVVFRINTEVKGIWSQDESHLVKGKIFMSLINLIHEKTDDDWLMTVHASAITNGKKTILFSAPPNHGKTTIAALLQERGYRLISDDFVPIDRDSFKAYPFPIAMSVKESSTKLLASLFPALEQEPLNYISPEKSVRYLSTNDGSNLKNDVFPVQEFVFVKYDKSVDFQWAKLKPLSAMKLLLDQAWIAPTNGNAELFFNRIIKKAFYQLTYSSNQKALEAITQLFDND